MYPQLVELLIGDNPKHIKGEIEFQQIMKIVHKHYWTGKYKAEPLYGITHQESWVYNEESEYVDNFIKLRIHESTGLSVADFLDSPYDFAIDILDKEYKRAEKEMKEEERRRARQEAEAQRQRIKERAQAVKAKGRR